MTDPDAVATTLTDDEVQTRRLDRAPTGVADDADTGDDATDTGDTGDDAGDAADTTDTGDDAGDVSDTGDSNA